MSQGGYLALAIAMMALLLALFVIFFLLNKKTPPPPGCQDSMPEGCEGCQQQGCAFAPADLEAKEEPDASKEQTHDDPR